MTRDYDPASLGPLHKAFIEVWRNNNLAALGAFYTDVAVMLPPGKAVISGREAIVAYWSDARRIQNLAFAPAVAKSVSLHALREAGDLIVTMRGRGRDTFERSTKYITVWCEAEGSWKIDCMAWSGTGDGKRGRHRRPQGQQGRGSNSWEWQGAGRKRGR